MKQSVNFSQFVDAFHAMKRYDSFGYHGLRIIFDYLKEYEESTGEDIVLDVIAICCDYSMNDYATIAQDYRIDLSDADGDAEEEERIVTEYLEENTIVLGVCADGIVYQCF